MGRERLFEKSTPTGVARACSHPGCARRAVKPLQKTVSSRTFVEDGETKTLEVVKLVDGVRIERVLSPQGFVERWRTLPK